MALTRPRAYQIYDIDYKQAVRVVTVSNITLSGGAPNSVDGVNLSLNDRILVTGQTNGVQNGIYYVTTLGTGANGTWTRSIDTDATGELLSGTIVMVTEGAIYADTQWKLTTNDPITIGVTSLTFVQNYLANSISYGGTSFAVNSSNANATISVSAVSNVVVVAPTTATFAANILPNANVTYNLGSTTNRWKDIWLSNSTIYLGNVTLSASGDDLTVNSANVVTSDAAGNTSTTGNVTSGNLLTSGQVSSTGNITSAANIAGGNILATTLVNGTSITGTTISAGANITGGNILTGGLISSTGNITSAANVSGGNVVATTIVSAATVLGSVISASGNITGGNVLTSGIVSSSGNITGANLVTSGLVASKDVSATGNIYATGFISVTGNLYVANVISQGNLSVEDPLLYLTANTPYPYNYDIGFFSQFQTLPGTETQANGYQHTGFVRDQTDSVWKLFSNVLPEPGVTIDFTNAAYDTLLAGGVSSTGNITATSNIAGGNILISGLVSATGNITGNYIIGNGSQLTGLPASYSNTNVATYLASGTNSSNIITTGNVSGGNLLTSGLISATGNATVGNITATIGSFTTFNSSQGGNVSGTLIATSSNAQFFNQTNASGYVLISGYVSAAGNITSASNIAGGNVLATTVVSAASILGSTVSASANITGGNLLTSGLISATGNVSVGNLNVTGNIVDTGSLSIITGSNGNIALAPNGTGIVTASGAVSAVGNITSAANVAGGNLLTGGLISATGNITGNYIIGNGSQLTGLPASYGNTNVASFLAAFGSNTISTTGTVTAGNITGANIITDGKVYGLELSSTQSAGSEGGQINLAIPATNTSLVSGVTIDIYQNQLRFFQGDSAKGAYIDLTACSPGVGTNLLASGGGGTPGGANTNVQFNDGGAFGGNGQFVYNKVTNTLTVGIVSANNNGSGTNFQVGDDAWIGDINVADTIGIKGQQNPANAYIIFGNSDSTGKLGRAGTGPLTYAGAFSASGNITAGNILTSGLISATGNIIGGNIISGGGSGGNISGANVISATTLSATANITGGNLLTGGLISSTGNITSSGNISSGNILNTGIVSSTGNISSAGNVSGGNALITTTVSAASHIGSIVSVTGNVSSGNLLATTTVSAASHIGSIVSVTGNVSAGNLTLSGTTIIGPMTSNDPTQRLTFKTSTASSYSVLQVAPSNTLAQFAGFAAFNKSDTGNAGYGFYAIDSVNAYVEIGASGTGTQPSAFNINIPGAGATKFSVTSAGNTSVTGNLIVSANASVTSNITAAGHIGTVYTNSIINTGANGTGNIGSSTLYFNTAFVKATSAQYADVAEWYASDADYPPGTVLSFGGTTEVTLSNKAADDAVAGVVSTNPAYIMNAGINSSYKVPVALTGRVPTKVIGPVRKGNMMVSAGNGYAQACSTPAVGTVIGKSIENFDGTEGIIEIVVGRV